MAQAQVTVDQVVAAFVKLRDEKEEIEKRHAAELTPLRDKLDKLQGWLHAQLLAQKVESFKTAEGTAFLQRNDSATVKDFTALLDWVRETGEWSVLTAAVSKVAVRDVMKRAGICPPGVEFKSELVTRVHRPKGG